MNIRIGTRGSKLALWQAYEVEKKLREHGASTEIIKIDTKGDKILDVSISKIGSKGVFTEEIEAELQNGNIDIAVHSAKDMPSVLPTGFELIAFGEREKANDVLVSNKDLNLSSQNLRIGTSSTRRVAFLKKFYNHVDVVSVRGNLQTRFRKMSEGQCDALLLAYAGVHRMEYEESISEFLPLDTFIPAVGQGSVAIESFNTLDEEKRDFIRAHFNDEEAELAIKTERAFLKKMQGGCSVPIFGYARIMDKKIKIQGGIISLDGTKFISKSMIGDIEENEQLGIRLGDHILQNGGKEILNEIKEQLAL